MKGKKDEMEIDLEIRKVFIDFDKEKFLTQTKWVIPILYNELKDGNENNVRVKCDKELINKLSQKKEKYRIIKEMDHLSVQYANLYDYIKMDNEVFLKVYTSVYFYDNVRNNAHGEDSKDKYWNDIWIITYKNVVENKTGNKYNCENCGATMKYNKNMEFFECDYCSTIVYNSQGMNWEMVDIEVME